MKRSLAFACALGLAALVCQSARALTLDDVSRAIGGFDTLRADYSQVRTFSGGDDPLKSSGSMLLCRSKGLIWEQSEPFSMTLAATSSRIIQDVEGARETLTREGNPQAFEISQALLGAMTDPASSARDFKAEASGSKDAWKAVLVPKEGTGEAAVIKRIELEGGAALERAVILDQAGGRTEIAFSNQKTGVSLSDQEAQLLE